MGMLSTAGRGFSVSGFTYVRNGLTYGYPFLEAIHSALPLCDEFVVAVGDSNDGTREALAALKEPKLRLIDTVWDEERLRQQDGRIFAEQCNTALHACKGTWLLHLQADEVLHQDDLPALRTALQHAHDDQRIEALLLRFLNFVGGYQWVAQDRRYRNWEVRLLRRQPHLYAYKDSMGFRLHPSAASYQQGQKGRKLRAARTPVRVFHYTLSRPPQAMQDKARYMGQFYHSPQELEAEYAQASYDFHRRVGAVQAYQGSHPAVMQAFMEANTWPDPIDPAQLRFKNLRHALLSRYERLTGHRPWDHRNWVEVPLRPSKPTGPGN